jgi:hypothetical protein
MPVIANIVGMFLNAINQRSYLFSNGGLVHDFILLG